MSCKVQQSVCSDCVTYVKSRIKFNTFNTFNNVKNMMINAVAGLVALCGLVMLIGDTPGANAATFAAVKISGGALLYIAYKVMGLAHPEWEEEEV